jgi:hypothetical protein
MTTAHLAAKPPLTYNFYIYLDMWPNISWPHDTHWPHASPTVIGRVRAVQFYRPEVTMTAHLAAKPLLIFIYIYIFIYTLVMWTTSTCLATLQSWAAFEPYIHWPHSSLTITGRVRALHSLAASEPKTWTANPITRGLCSKGTGSIGHT